MFFLYLEYVGFVQVSGTLGGMTAFDSLRSGFEGYDSPPRLIRICVYILNLKDNVCIDYFQKVHANSFLHMLIISQI